MRQVAEWAWVLGLSAMGCARELPPAEAPPAAPLAAVVEAKLAPPPVLTVTKLDAFLRYQRQRLEAEAALEREVGEVASRLEDRGAAGQRAARQAMRVLEAKAEAEARARDAAGLSLAEVRHFTELVAAVLQPRLLLRTLALDDTLRTLEEQMGKLRGDIRTELEAQLAPLRTQREALKALTEERRRFGDAAVELILSREAELLRQHDERLAWMTASSP